MIFESLKGCSIQGCNLYYRCTYFGVRIEFRTSTSKSVKKFLLTRSRNWNRFSNKAFPKLWKGEKTANNYKKTLKLIFHSVQIFCSRFLNQTTSGWSNLRALAAQISPPSYRPSLWLFVLSATHLSLKVEQCLKEVILVARTEVRSWVLSPDFFGIFNRWHSKLQQQQCWLRPSVTANCMGRS